MYKIELFDEVDGNIFIIAEDQEELIEVINSVTKGEYTIIRVKYVEPLQTAKEFLEEIKDQIKPKQPKDLVFGNVKKELRDLTSNPDNEGNYKLCEDSENLCKEEN